MIDEKRGLGLFQIFTMLYCFGYGTYSEWRGGYWIFNAEKASTETPLYESMHEILSLFWWGLPFSIAGLMLVISGLLIPYHKSNNYFLAFFVSSHVILAAFYYILTLAGFENGLNILTPGQNLTWAVVSGIMAFVGGMALWNQKTKKK